MFWQLALKFAAQVVPWESIIAWILNQVLSAHRKQLNAGNLAAVQQTTNRVVESVSAFASVSDTLVKSAQTGQVQPADVATATTAVRAALDAWSNQQPTPAAYSAIFRADTTAPAAPAATLTPVTGDGTVASPRAFAAVPGQVVLTQADVAAQLAPATP